MTKQEYSERLHKRINEILAEEVVLCPLGRIASMPELTLRELRHKGKVVEEVDLSEAELDNHARKAIAASLKKGLADMAERN